MPSSIRVLLVDDHPVVISGLRAICADEPRIEVVGEAYTEAQALELVELLRPDILTVPIRLEGSRGGVELIREIRAIGPTRVIVFTSFTRPIDLQVASLAGASALVSKESPAAEVIDAILRVAEGGDSRPFDTGIEGLTCDPRGSLDEPLTDREQEILRLVLEGLTNVEISRRASIQLSTVKTHMRNILRKLGVSSRKELR